MFKTVLISLFASLSFQAHAFEVACPELANKILNKMNLASSINSPLGGTAVESVTWPNGTQVKSYKNIHKNIKVEISASSDGQWSDIAVLNGTNTEISVASIGEASKKGMFYTSYLVQNCQIASIVSNRASVLDEKITQVTAGNQFCRNMNAGKKPQPYARYYLAFDGENGSILASKEADTKVMCSEAAWAL